MSRLTASECAALEQFANVVGEAGFVLVGAAALGFHVNMTWRRTADLDLVLALPMEALSATVARVPGWSRDERREHRWIAPGDIAHAMHEFLAPDADERFTIAAGTDYDNAGAFIVGRRLSAIVNEDEREAIARFLAKLRDEDDRHHSQARMLRESPRAWAEEPDDLLRRLVALEDGLGIPL